MRLGAPKRLMTKLAEQAAWRGATRSIRSGRRGVPGELISRLPESDRTVLRELRSDDIANVHPLYGYEPY